MITDEQKERNLKALEEVLASPEVKEPQATQKELMEALLSGFKSMSQTSRFVGQESAVAHILDLLDQEGYKDVASLEKRFRSTYKWRPEEY